jgi:putative Ca2+/H+ antiporter (TMEM165/GDT1 family)
VEWRALGTAFGLVFLAELGDKTQLTTLLLAARYRAPAAVFAGAALALVSSSLLGVALGAFLAARLPGSLLRVAAGAAFVLLGAFLLLERR